MTDTDHRQIVDTGLEHDGGLDYHSKPERVWTAFDRSEAYLDSRPVGGPYNPRAEYGDPDWREPESDDEAAARTAHLEAQPRSPETLGWIERIAAISEQDRDVIEAGIAMTHAQATHDPDEIAEATANYQAAVAASYARPDRGVHDQPESGEDELSDLLDGEFTDPEPEFTDPEPEFDEEEAER